MIKRPTILALLLILGITTAQNAQTPPAPPPGPPPAPKNLQVFPQDIPRERLIAAMRGFTAGLGVKCNHCHVVKSTEPKEVLDFPNDTKPEKRVARVMIQMVAQINGSYLPRVETAEHGEDNPAAPAPAAVPDEADNRVSCWTCHRGQKEPDMPPPPEKH